MATVYGFSPIIQNGLIFAADAGNARCFTEGASTCVDMSGGFIGTLQGPTGDDFSPIYSSDGNGSWQFDGIDDEINFGTSTRVASLAGTANLTIGGWVKKDSAIDTALFGAYNNTLPHGFGLLWYTDGNVLFYLADGSIQWNFVALTWTDSWFYLVGVFDGTQFTDSNKGKIYVNSIEQSVSTNSPPSSISSTVPEMTIGTLQDTSLFTEGKMTGITVYNRSLTDEEVLYNYNAQKSRFGL